MCYLVVLSQFELYFSHLQATQTFEWSGPMLTCTYQTMVAEIAYLQLNLGMEVTVDVPGY